MRETNELWSPTFKPFNSTSTQTPMAGADTDHMEGDMKARRTKEPRNNPEEIIGNIIANRAQQNVEGNRSFPIPHQHLQI